MQADRQIDLARHPDHLDIYFIGYLIFLSRAYLIYTSSDYKYEKCVEMWELARIMKGVKKFTNGEK